MSDAIIKLVNLNKTYFLTKKNKVVALRNINLEINDGEFVAIMGPSGSGKSTLLNLIGLLDEADSDGSKIIIDKHNVADLKARQKSLLRRETIGFVFQNFNLLPKLSAFDNVLLPMRYAQVPRKESHERAQRLLRLVSLEKRAKHKPVELSGGEKQRVAIARALANRPKIILADEPTGNLDSKSGVEIVNILKKLNREQKVTVVMITHDQDIAARADRIIKLKDGQLC